MSDRHAAMTGFDCDLCTKRRYCKVQFEFRLHNGPDSQFGFVPCVVSRFALSRRARRDRPLRFFHFTQFSRLSHPCYPRRAKAFSTNPRTASAYAGVHMRSLCPQPSISCSWQHGAAPPVASS